jgi:cytochrome b
VNRVRVWDWPVRLAHWALVLCIAGLYATGEYGWLDMQWHFRFGYLALSIVLFRILWGFVGSEHARFADFVRGPRAVLEHLRTFGQAGARRWLGHNPLGALSVLALLGLVLLQAISGLFSNDEIAAFGPLSERISTEASAAWTELHEWLQGVLLVFIGLHLLAIAAYRLIRGEDLVTPMWTGYKAGPGRNARWQPLWLAIVLYALCLAAVLAVAYWGPPA